MARKPPAGAAYAPPPYDKPTVAAMKALARGEASEDQQRRALQWIVHVAAATYDQSFRPGADGERDSCFAEGRRFVGNQMLKLINTPMHHLRFSHARPSTDAEPGPEPSASPGEQPGEQPGG